MALLLVPGLFLVAVGLCFRNWVVYAERGKWIWRASELATAEINTGDYAHWRKYYQAIDDDAGYIRMLLTFWRRPSSFCPEELR